MKRGRFSAAIILTAVALFLVNGCGSNGSTPVTLTLTPTTDQTVDEGQTVAFAASQSVNWSITLNNATCSGPNCGTLTNVTATSVTYTAPNNLNSATTVSLTAKTVATPTATVNVAITTELPPTITPTPLPGGMNGTPYSQTIQATGGVAPLSFSLKSGSLPSGLVLNSTGLINGIPGGPFPPNPANFTATVKDNGTPPLTESQAFSIFIAPAPPLSISTTLLGDGTVGAMYNAPITAQGGVPPLTWKVLSGNLPPGLKLDPSTGQVTGIPTLVGTSSFTPQVQDSAIPKQTAQTPNQLSITIQLPPPLQINTPSLPPGTTATAYSGPLAATGGAPPYSWSIITGQPPSGLTLDPNTGVLSGTPILVGSPQFTVEVQDSEATPMTATKTFTVPVKAGNNNDSLLNGTYVFLFNGFNANGVYAAAGQFVADGAGNISSGIEDINADSGVTSNATSTGTYTIGSDGRGSISLTVTASNGAKLLVTYDLILYSDGSARFIENDSTGIHGAGILKPQLGTSFAAGNFNGNYALEFQGSDSKGKREVMAGVIHADGSVNLSPGTADINDAGSLASSLTLSGNFGSIASTGRGTANLTLSIPVTLKYNFYFVSSSDLFFIAQDPIDATHPRLSGEMVLQQPTTTFDLTALNGNSVAAGTGLSSNASVFVGLLSANGGGTASLAFNQNNGGSITPTTTLPGTYSIATNGRVSFTNLGTRVAIAYLTGPNQGYLIGKDPEATSGLLENQSSAPPFVNSSVQGGYTLSAPAGADSQGAQVVGQTSADGIMTLTGTVDEVDASGTAHTAQSLLASYAVAATAQGTFTTNSPTGIPKDLVFYIVSPGKIRCISTDSTDTHPEVFFFDH